MIVRCEVDIVDLNDTLNSSTLTAVNLSGSNDTVCIQIGEHQFAVDKEELTVAMQLACQSPSKED